MPAIEEESREEGMKKRQERRMKRKKERGQTERERKRTVLWASRSSRSAAGDLCPPLFPTRPRVPHIHAICVKRHPRHHHYHHHHRTRIAVGDGADVSITFRCERARPTTRSSAAHRHPRASASSLTLGSGADIVTLCINWRYDAQSACLTCAGKEGACKPALRALFYARPIENTKNQTPHLILQRDASTGIRWTVRASLKVFSQRATNIEQTLFAIFRK